MEKRNAQEQKVVSVLLLGANTLRLSVLMTPYSDISEFGFGGVFEGTRKWKRCTKEEHDIFN